MGVTDARTLLQESIDLSALDTLFVNQLDGTPREPGALVFTIDGYQITIVSTGYIEIVPQTRIQQDRTRRNTDPVVPDSMKKTAAGRAWTPAMQGGRNSADTSDSPAYSTETLLGVLSSVTRRTVLFHLRQHGVATVDELVDVLTEVGDATDEPDEVDRRRLKMSLVHVHLPRLAEHELVAVDTDDGVVESTIDSSEVGEWLDLAVRRDIRFDPDPEVLADTHADIRVLLVDDEPSLSDTIAAIIERDHDDIEVTTATSALEAVTTLEEESFDCIVSDYMMPAISGLDFLNAVRDEDPDIPFIVFTAKGSEETASNAIASGVTDYVRKGNITNQADELVKHIRKAVE
jgi:CheY-like chemotaxis protein